jgi:hypothetical protein
MLFPRSLLPNAELLLFTSTQDQDWRLSALAILPEPGENHANVLNEPGNFVSTIILRYWS